MEAIDAVDGPCLFVANHMSTLETFMLPGIIRPRRPVTFVVKQSLTTMPFFGPVMRSRDPIVVGRTNPREDLKAVLEGGLERLRKGISIIVFPQHTRSSIFAPQQFNSIGIKLAKKAAVPVVPLALKDRRLGNGQKNQGAWTGPAGVARTLQLCPSAADQRSGQRRTTPAICRYIDEHLRQWQRTDGINA